MGLGKGHIILPPICIWFILFLFLFLWLMFLFLWLQISPIEGSQGCLHKGGGGYLGELLLFFAFWFWGNSCWCCCSPASAPHLAFAPFPGLCAILWPLRHVVVVVVTVFDVFFGNSCCCCCCCCCCCSLSLKSNWMPMVSPWFLGFELQNSKSNCYDDCWYPVATWWTPHTQNQTPQNSTASVWCDWCSRVGKGLGMFESGKETI